MIRNAEPQENNATLRFAIVGAGAIAQSYGDALKIAPSANLVAVVDVDEEAAAKLAEKAGAAAYGSVEELLAADPALDGAVVCTPPATHPDVCIDLLEGGVDVLCEKPLAINMAGAYRMAEAARQYERLFTMASKFRYVEDVRKAKELLDSGAIGDVILFENAFTSCIDMSGRWNSKPGISGGGVLIDNGTHSLDLARYFLGPLDELQVIEGKRSQGLAVEETVSVYFHSRSGVMGSIDLSWTIHKELPTYITLYGTEGTISLGWKESKVRKAGGEWEIFGNGYSKVEAFRNQIENFAGAILSREDLVITMEDGLASVAAIEAAYAALAQNPWVAVRRAGRGAFKPAASETASLPA